MRIPDYEEHKMRIIMDNPHDVLIICVEGFEVRIEPCSIGRVLQKSIAMRSYSTNTISLVEENKRIGGQVFFVQDGAA